MSNSAEDDWRHALASLPDPAALATPELLQLIDVFGQLQTALDALKLRAVGQLSARWTAIDDESPALRDGHRNPATMLAERWQISVPAARELCSVAEAVTPATTHSGELLPAPYPLLATAIETNDGSRLSVDQAAVIVRELAKAAPACTAHALRLAEGVLVRAAPDITVAGLRLLAGQVRNRLDEDGILPREERQRSRRSLTISTTQAGLTHIDWYLHPEAAGHVVSAIDALVGHELRAVRFRVTNGPDFAADRADEEQRTLEQLRSDAATDVFRYYGAGGAGAPAVPVSVVVRIGLGELRSGRGFGEIDGVRTPISAATARRMAADADIIPVVLGGKSEVLDVGRARRLFSPTQKLALAERDGGCAWAGCPHPPSYTEAHHIRWWEKHHGTTDLDNGILLCSNHHHRVHDDGWEIEMRDHVPWFIPPSHIDRHRRPRRGGRIRLHDTAA